MRRAKTTTFYTLMLVLLLLMGAIGGYIYRKHAKSSGTITLKGILESVTNPEQDAGDIYRVKTPDGQVWSAQNCGLVNLPPATIEKVAPGNKVTIHGKIDMSRVRFLNLCGAKSYFVRKQEE